jgi:site-specific DNA-methyltransferase (adenine-specific)
LSPEEYAALKADIAERGVQIPIEVDADSGEVLDGFHRLRACQELGLEAPVATRHFTTDEQRTEHAIKLNMLRRQLGPVAWAEAFGRLRKARGVQDGPGRPLDSYNSATVAELAAELGVPERTARRRMKLAADLADHPDLAARVDAGELAASRARELARKQEQQEDNVQPGVPLPTNVKLIHGTFQEAGAEIASESVQWVITDPPYGQDALELYGELGALSTRVLVPGGSLLVMVGQSYLPEVLAALAQHLRYHWTIAYLTPGGQAVQVWHRKVNAFWKPVLWFVKGEYAGDWVGDVARSAPNDNDKQHHRWGQSESGMLSLMDKYLKPGDVVLDPMMGAGTTGLAALVLGCSFVGIDSDAESVSEARQRIAGAMQDVRSS